MDDAPADAERTHSRLPRLEGDRREMARLGALLLRTSPDLTLIVSATPGGGALAGLVPAGHEARWWASGVAPPAHPLARMTTRALHPLLAGDAGSGGDAATAAAGALLWSAIDRRARGRGRLPLWDGDYVLAPHPLAGETGAATLDAFARVAEDRSELELVVLADPQPEFERRARALGIGPRVHFAGPAAPEAWRAWLGGASAAVIAGERISAGTVLRALACGCPLVACGGTPAAVAVRGWLEPHGALVDAAPASAGPPPELLQRVLERAPDTLRAIAAGRALVEGLTPEALAARLTAVIPGVLPRRAAA